MKEPLTVDQIRSTYPDEWVLVGNPMLGDTDTIGSIVSKLQSGIVLYHSKDKREIAYKAKELTQDVERFACIFTGEVPKNRRFWL
jgi:hypothetical protein